MQAEPENNLRGVRKREAAWFQAFQGIEVRIALEVGVMTDTGYQGIAKTHANSELPRKRSKRNPLAKEGRRRRFGLRFNLVAGICNYELSC